MTARVEDDGLIDAETICIAANGYKPPPHHRNGNDLGVLCAWPEIGILDTQLDPNRTGRKR